MAAEQPWTNLALLLNQEVSAVVTAMRQNSRWAMVPTRYTVIFDNCPSTSYSARPRTSRYYEVWIRQALSVYRTSFAQTK